MTIMRNATAHRRAPRRTRAARRERAVTATLDQLARHHGHLNWLADTVIDAIGDVEELESKLHHQRPQLLLQRQLHKATAHLQRFMERANRVRLVEQ